MTIGNHKMFVSPISFTGRIGRLEYVLSAILILALYFGLLFVLKYLDAKSFELMLRPYLYALFSWFGLAQAVKRCHDLGHSGWCMLIPFYGFVMLFVKGNEGGNEYGSAPGSDVAVDSVDKSGTMRNSYVRLYFGFMIVVSSGVVYSICVNLSHGGEALSDILFWIREVIKIIDILGLILLFHYRKAAFYAVSAVGLYHVVMRLYNIYYMFANYDNKFADYDNLGFLLVFLNFFWLVIYSSVLFLYPMLKKTSEWENLENNFHNLSWKSVLLCLFAVELGKLCYWLLLFIER